MPYPVSSARGRVYPARAWTPAAPGGLLTWIEPGRSAVWHDTARALPAGDGCRVGAMEDLSGNGNHATPQTSVTTPAATNAAPVYRRTHYSGVPAVDIGPSAVSTAGVLYVPAANPGNAATLVFATKWLRVGAGDNLFSWNNSGTGTPFIDAYSLPTQITLRGRNDANTLTASATAAMSGFLNSWIVWTVTWDGTTITLYRDNVSVRTVALSGTTTLNQIRFPTTGAGTGRSDLRLGPVLVYSASLGTADRLAAYQYVLARTTGTAETVPAAAAAPTVETGFDLTTAAMTLSGVAASANGNVDSLPSTSGTVPMTLTLPGATTAPVLRVEGGVNVLEFGTSGQPALAAALPGGTRSVAAMTVNLLIRATAAKEMAVLAFGNNAHPSLGLPQDSARSDIKWVGVASTGASSSAAQFNALDTSAYHLWSFVYDGAGQLVRTFVDGMEQGAYDSGSRAVAQVAAATTFSQYGIRLGSNADNPIGCGFRVAYLSVNPAAATPYQHRQTVAWARGQYPTLMPALTRNLVIFDGASNYRTGSDTAQTIPELYRAGTAKTVDVYAVARGSTTSWSNAGRIDEEAACLLYGRSGTNVVCHFAGGNDPTLLSDNIAGGTTTNTIAEVTYWAQKWRAAATRAGVTVKLLVMYQISRSAIDNVGAAWRGNYKTALDGLVTATTIDGVVDVTGIPEVWANNAYANATYYADGIHLTASGTTLVAARTVTDVDAQLP